MNTNKENDVIDINEQVSTEKFNKRLSVVIGATLEIKSNFELYSYRIIEPQVFMERFKEIVQFVNENA